MRFRQIRLYQRMMLTTFALICVYVAILGTSCYLKARPEPPSRPLAKWEQQAWNQTPCESCGRSIGFKSKQDGVYMVGEDMKVLHASCAKRILAEHEAISKPKRKQHGPQS